MILVCSVPRKRWILVYNGTTLVRRPHLIQVCRRKSVICVGSAISKVRGEKVVSFFRWCVFAAASMTAVVYDWGAHDTSTHRGNYWWSSYFSSTDIWARGTLISLLEWSSGWESFYSSNWSGWADVHNGKWTARYSCVCRGNAGPSWPSYTSVCMTCGCISAIWC